MTELSLTAPHEPSAPADAPDPRLAPRPRLRRRLGPGRTTARGRAAGPVLLLVAWIAASASGALAPATLSPPWTVVTTFGELVAEDGCRATCSPPCSGR